MQNKNNKPDQLIDPACCFYFHHIQFLFTNRNIFLKTLYATETKNAAPYYIRCISGHYLILIVNFFVSNVDLIKSHGFHILTNPYFIIRSGFAKLSLARFISRLVLNDRLI